MRARSVLWRVALLTTTLGAASHAVSRSTLAAQANNTNTTGDKISPGMLLYDFRTVPSVSDWHEVSDTVRLPGMSKAALVLQRTRQFQRAIFFTLLNPQPNGAGFAGMVAERDWNLAAYKGFELRVRAQGQSDTYKLVLKSRDRNVASEAESCCYEGHYKIAPLEWSVIRLPFEDFKPFFRGRPCPDAPSLDTSSINSIGLQIAGGVYTDHKQSGAASLEIDYIKAY